MHLWASLAREIDRTEIYLNFFLLSGYGSSGDFSQSQAGIAMDRQFMELSRGRSVHHPQEPPGIIAMLLNPSSNSVVHEYTAPVAAGERSEGVKCPECHKMFTAQSSMMDHKEAVHDNVANVCVCGKSYKYKPGLRRHKVTCPFVQSQIHGWCIQDDHFPETWESWVPYLFRWKVFR